ncbi:general substrate transporter [Atractiella rhizophila]|jgi:sugar porter (SP) family MFS transporter|nr:general substrate transporter [Atractiella rhizophila]
MDAVVAQNRGPNPGPWYKRKDILALNLLLTSCLITSSANGFDASSMGALQALPPWVAFFNDPQGSTLGLFGAIQNIGSLCAIPFSPFVADILGRKPCIIFGCLVMILGAALQGAAQNFGTYIAARGVLGFGLQFAQSAAPMLITELAYPSQRAQITAIFNSLWYTGAVVASWTIYGTYQIDNNWSWRIPALLQGVAPVFQLSLLFFVPESPRWLVSKGKEDRAAQVIAKYHARGDINDPLVTFEMSEIKEALAQEEEIKRTTNFFSLLNTRGNRKRFLIITGIAFFSQWSGNGLVSYYIVPVLKDAGITQQSIILLINALLAVFNTIMAVGAAVLVERLGRRTLFLASNIGMLFMWTIWTSLAGTYEEQGNEAAGKAVIAFIFLYYAFYDIAYSPLLVAYTVEILPFNLRAKGVAFMNFCVSASLVFNQYINPIALRHIHWHYYLVYLGWLVFELAFVWKLVVETKGLTLEETALLFDGEDKKNTLERHAADKAQGAGVQEHDVASLSSDGKEMSFDDKSV